MNIPTFQSSLATKSRQQPNYRFGGLYKVISEEEWLKQALEKVLENTGARTAGIDGIARDDLRSGKRRNALARRLHASLRSGNYHPKPVRRVYIPKPGKDEMRPLGIPTIADRVVQEALRMVMEPIWESKFLRCSHGFRPGHRTMDCVYLCRTRIQPRNKFYWVIEGDIRKCFDRINHRILINQIERGTDDHRLLDLCSVMLEAGVMEDGLVSPSLEGTPQGGIISPLWANIYLHDFDQWHWDNYTGLTRKDKAWRRKHGLGNAVMTRYADDFIVLTNGTHSGTQHMKDEIAEFMQGKLKLELNMEKTHVTHVQDGFDFLGFHMLWRTKKGRASKAWLQITPTKGNIHKVKDKIRDLTGSRMFYIPDRELFLAANAIIRGWAHYYQHVNAMETFSSLDWWLNQRLVRRLQRKYNQPIGKILTKYRQRQTVNARGKPCNRWNLYADSIWLFLASDVKKVKYYPTREQWETNPYSKAQEGAASLPEHLPYGHDTMVYITQKTCELAERRRQVLKRDEYTCQECDSKITLEVHHRKRRSAGGKHNPANLVTLCQECHKKRTYS